VTEVRLDGAERREQLPVGDRKTVSRSSAAIASGATWLPFVNSA
jgi:hypothetical protein